MKYIKSYKIFESLENSQISIEDFLQQIRIPHDKFSSIINWWNENRNDIKIHYFSFNSPQPIAGVFLGEDTICVNSRLPMPPHIKLFLALHESRHCDQHKEEGFMEGYYNSVVNGDKENFLSSYQRLEKDANDFAINAMREIGFETEMNFEEMRLRSNERAGEMVYRMMSSDIMRLQPTDFFDLLKKQIGV
jgi:hypothetical protein